MRACWFSLEYGSLARLVWIGKQTAAKNNSLNSAPALMAANLAGGGNRRCELRWGAATQTLGRARLHCQITAGHGRRVIRPTNSEVGPIYRLMHLVAGQTDLSGGQGAAAITFLPGATVAH